MLGGQVVCEINSTGGWTRGYVYLGGQLLAVQAGGVNWVHMDPVTKGQRLTDSAGAVVSTIEVDPWGGETWRSVNSSLQPRKYTTYERDGDGNDEAQMRRYGAGWGRFAQPDPYEGSYELTDPQSLNRYSYVQNDPINFVDPSGLNASSSGCNAEFSYEQCGGDAGFWGGGWGNWFAIYGGMSAGELRYESIRTTGYDPEFRRYWGDVALQILDRQGNVLYQGAWMHRPTLDMVWSAASNMAEGMARNRVREELRGLGLEGHINLTPKGAGFIFTVNAISADVVSSLLENTTVFSASGNPLYYLFHYKDAQCASGGCVDYRSWPGAIGAGSMQFVYNSSALRGTVDIDRFNPRAGVSGFLGHAFLEVIPNALSDVPNIPGVSYRGFPMR